MDFPCDDSVLLQLAGEAIRIAPGQAGSHLNLGIILAVSGRVTVGGLWSGRQRTASGTITVRPSYKLRLATGVQRTSADLDLPAASFKATLLTMRANYSFSTRMFLDGLTQYDPERHLFNANLRLNLIHHPLSDLYIVLNEQRLSLPDQPDLSPGRSVIVKFTQMFSF